RRVEPGEASRRRARRTTPRQARGARACGANSRLAPDSVHVAEQGNSSAGAGRRYRDREETGAFRIAEKLSGTEYAGIHAPVAVEVAQQRHVAGRRVRVERNQDFG